MSNELILAISGNDIFSGGGLHADLATYTTNKQHGFVAVTCLTAMTEHGFEVIPVDPTTFAQQLHSLKDVELIKFFPYVTIITPNLPEAEILTQRKIQSLDDMKEAARKLHELGAATVVVKGGNRLNKEKAIDVFYDGQDFTVFEEDVLEKNNTGAGCTFASSIASQ